MKTIQIEGNKKTKFSFVSICDGMDMKVLQIVGGQGIVLTKLPLFASGHDLEK